MRPAGVKSNTWLTWRFLVVSKDARGRDVVEISTVNGTPNPARCEGSLRPSTTSCASTKVGIGAGAKWVVVPLEGRGDGAFSLVAAASAV